MNVETKQPQSLIRCDEVYNNGISYKFSLLEDHKLGSEYPLYTVTIEMRGEDGVTTAATAKNVFEGTSRAISFYEKMVRNLATPIDLAYAVEDETE